VRLAYLVLLLGCHDSSKPWYKADASPVYESGYTLALYGDRTSGYAPNADRGAVLPLEIAQALENRAKELSQRAPVQEAVSIATMKSLLVMVVDDYNFAIVGKWASGYHEDGLIIVALWSRCETADPALIPADAPAWTIRPPDWENVNWRYGYRPLVPAADHELGHELFGPSWEHN
jgi:hypothetical protein